MESKTTTNMANPSQLDLDLTTPQRSQFISGMKRNNPDSPDSYSPSDKQLNNSRNNLELSLLCRNHSKISLLTKSRVIRLFSFQMSFVLP